MVSVRKRKPATIEQWPTLPVPLRRLRMLATTGPSGTPMGVLADGTTYTAVLTLGTAGADDGQLGPAASSRRWSCLALTVPMANPLAMSYLEIVEAAAPDAPADGTLGAYVAVQVDAGLVGRLAGTAADGDDDALAALRRDVAGVIGRLAGDEMSVTGALSPRDLARTVRVTFDPAARPGRPSRAAADPERAGSGAARLVGSAFL